MYRVDTSTAAAAPPALDPVGTQGYFTKGDPSTGTLATVPGQDWFNAVQEELCGIVLAAGIGLDKTNRAQVLAALNNIFARLAVANVFTATQTVQSTTAGAGSGPEFILDRQQGGGAGTSFKIGNFGWNSKRNNGTTVRYANILAMITDSGDAQYSGQLIFEHYKSAALISPAMSLGGNTGGLVVGGATEQGDGSVNAGNGIFDAGLRLKPNPIGAPTARVANTVFQAATDLLIEYTCASGGGGVPAGAQGLTDAANPPTVQRTAVTSDTTYGGGGPGISTGLLAVRKGEYWKVAGQPTTIFEYPVGT